MFIEQFFSSLVEVSGLTLLSVQQHNYRFTAIIQVNLH